jgi:hypothetical protein
MFCEVEDIYTSPKEVSIIVEGIHCKSRACNARVETINEFMLVFQGMRRRRSF